MKKRKIPKKDIPEKIMNTIFKDAYKSFYDEEDQFMINVHLDIQRLKVAILYSDYLNKENVLYEDAENAIFMGMILSQLHHNSNIKKSFTNLLLSLNKHNDEIIEYPEKILLQLLKEHDDHTLIKNCLYCIETIMSQYNITSKEAISLFDCLVPFVCVKNEGLLEYYDLYYHNI